MYNFINDYSEGACKEILQAMISTNFDQDTGYGEDKHCKNAAELIKKALNFNDVDIHFIPGGTPCNVLAISLLKPYEAVICVKGGHINVHETGAIEHTGHKIIETVGYDGKVLPEEIEYEVLRHSDEHMVKPRLVFISNSSEIGTIYSKKELIALREVCDKYGLYLYMDGARLSNALASIRNDLTLNDIVNLVDMFYIGGTKNGALIGEAFVIKNNALKENFRYYIKQNCSMLAKGKIIGIAFEQLFTDDVYLKNANHANQMATLLKQCFIAQGLELLGSSSTNQIFPIMPDDMINEIQKEYGISIWEKLNDGRSVVRFVTSWATPKDKVFEFIQFFENLNANI